MKVLVYEEGPSDRDGLTKLLGPVIDAGRAIQHRYRYNVERLADGNRIYGW